MQSNTQLAWFAHKITSLLNKLEDLFRIRSLHFVTIPLSQCLPYPLIIYYRAMHM